ncbi:hypothetical protein GOQ29_01110 [Clostridium sp. D2Q-14]|uniref:hypothetical protein n=1 Tax=Anaeromonas gelatinilytica TaxID=2683194 RepID=UPI00193BAE41|nr:hypothetical protein [Anaeromonas gelatinilytica]MBS4534210.1 hypothetical protein [Anaeromonas gelatinilytica]
MGINNHDKYKENKIVDEEAKKNYNEYNEVLKTIENLGSNDKMLTNIDSMDSQLKRLVINGDIEETDLEYELMSNVLEQAKEIQIKRKKSLEKTFEFYDNYNNFISIFKRVSDEDENV